VEGHKPYDCLSFFSICDQNEKAWKVVVGFIFLHSPTDNVGKLATSGHWSEEWMAYVIGMVFARENRELVAGATRGGWNISQQ
jgi:hypothetical protein